jgi:hypothetical protein
MQDIKNSGLEELLENHIQGLVWVTRNLDVQYANSKAKNLLGIAITKTIGDPALASAVAATIAGGSPHILAVMGVSNGPVGSQPELRCRVIRGLLPDDAFVLVSDPQSIDPAAAMDDLMVILRSDLHAPLQWVEQALRLAREDCCDGHTIDALAERVELLAQATRKLMDFAAIWAAGSSIANDRLELLQLLRQAWAEVEPLALDRAVKIRFSTQSENNEMATVYGNESWLRRVLVECLESEILAASPGTNLEILYRQHGPRATLVLRHCQVLPGSPAVSGTNRLRDDMEQRRQGLPMLRLTLREHISQKLCRHVLGLHGGQLREEEYNGQRSLIIDIPTGAPHRQSQRPLDIEQAQQYASDLVKLIERARLSPNNHHVTTC